jgi:hypothetical protein
MCDRNDHNLILEDLENDGVAKCRKKCSPVRESSGSVSSFGKLSARTAIAASESDKSSMNRPPSPLD